MRQFKYLSLLVFAMVAAPALMVCSGCGEEGNTVIQGELTPEQEADRNNVTMPSSPGESKPASLQ
jgi:hypothetical protein